MEGKEKKKEGGRDAFFNWIRHVKVGRAGKMKGLNFFLNSINQILLLLERFG